MGFIRKLPHHLVASFSATLEEARHADILAHVVDASHTDWEEQVEVVDGVLADLGETPRPVLHVFNKMDLVTEPEVFRAQAASRFENAVFISAAKGDVAGLVSAIASAPSRSG